MTHTRAAILVRVSSNSDRQDYTRQIRDLTPVCAARGWEVVETITAKVSATKTKTHSRDDIKALLALVDAGKIDRVVVTEITRIGRRANEVRDIIEYLRAKNVHLYIHSIGLDTAVDNEMQKAMVNIVLTILSELAEMEMHRLRDRIKSGMAAARAKGVQIGRKPGSTEDFAAKIKSNKAYRDAADMLNKGIAVRKIAKALEISNATVMKIKKEVLKPENKT